MTQFYAHFVIFLSKKKFAYQMITESSYQKSYQMLKVYSITKVTQNSIMSCILISASISVLYKFDLHNIIDIVRMVVLVVGSESS